jgi:hypothetical protein
MSEKSYAKTQRDGWLAMYIWGKTNIGRKNPTTVNAKQQYKKWKRIVKMIKSQHTPEREEGR